MLKQRIITALCLAPPLIAAIFLLPASAFTLLMTIVSLLAAFEWTRLARPELTSTISYVIVGAIGVTGIALMLFPDYVLHRALVLVVLLSGIGLWLMIWRRLAKSATRTPVRYETVIAGIASVVIALISTVYLHQDMATGPSLVFCFMLAVAGADIGAYFTGKKFGKNKLAPTLSPGKTREGVAGGVAVSALICAIVFVVTGFPFTDSFFANLVIGIGVGGVLAVVSVIGDLFASYGKRQANVKDSGQLLPGHGGILDRIDSMLAAAPVFAAMTVALVVWSGR